jgi:ribosomal protein S12 methylthiotransferase
MTQNPPDLRPDLAPRARITEDARPGQPTIGMVSLGCPKALVDSERILTRCGPRATRSAPTMRAPMR